MKKNLSKFAIVNRFPDLPIINGIKLASINAKIGKGNRPDLLLIEASPKSTICALFTKSKTCSAAVDWGRENLKKTQKTKHSIGIIVNSGNANVFTGTKGLTTVNKTVRSVTANLTTVPENVFVASTGVIGELLDSKKITSQIGKLTKNLHPDSFHSAAEAIMTTDTYPKGVAAELMLEDTKIKLTGIAKGSGMIAPNMATMLVFIFSDIDINKTTLQKIITNCNKISFNCITVDSDTSTSDSLFFVATGKAKMSKIESMKDPRAIKFQKNLSKVMLRLAKLIIQDGEGITKFIQVIVKGARTRKSAFKIGKTIANSPLVKTAFAGEDPNWGRVVMAIGKSGIKVDKKKISIFFGEHPVAIKGSVSETYNEVTVSEYMKNDTLVLTVDLGLGSRKASIYTCDLTHQYISINADYRS